jgi:multidrug efflux pump subunit AcrB
MEKHQGITAWFTRNNVAANLLMSIIIIGGLFSAMTINKEVFPAIKLNIVHVMIPYPSAAPEEIEETIIIKVEESIKEITGISEVTAIAQEGLANIRIEVDDDYEPKDILDEVKLKIDTISTFPDGTENPSIYLREAESPVLWISIYGNIQKKELKELTKTIREEITSLSEVTKANLQGVLNYEISVEVSENQLREYNLTFEQVAMAVRKGSLDLPGGSIKSDEGNILLRTKGQAYNEDEFANLVVMTRNDGSRVLLKDIATIRDGFEERLDYVSFNRKPAMVIGVTSIDGQNAINISEQIQGYVEKRKATLPAGVSMDIWGDLTYYLNGRLNMMLKNMYSGGLLVFLVLALFLEMKLAFWVILGLPVCFLGALFLMPMEPLNLSINVLTLFAFILVLGIVVDDAIIIGESAFSEIEKKGFSSDSVLKGVQKVLMPATFGVLTTIAAFMPMVMVSGPVAIIWRSIAAVVILCLIFSLIESKWILPAHLAHMSPKPFPNLIPPLSRFKTNFNTRFKSMVNIKYRSFLNNCLSKRYTVVAFFIGLFILSIGLIAGGKVRWVFFPDLPRDIIEVRLEMEDTSAEKNTLLAVKQIENALYRVNDNLYDEYQENMLKHSFVAMTSKSSAVMVVELTKGENRTVDAFEITKLWREEIPLISGIKEFDIRSTSNETDPIAFKITSNDFKQLSDVSTQIKSRLSDYAGVYDINDNFSNGNQEIQLKLLPEGEVMGLSLSDLAQQVRYAFYGYEAQRILRDKEEVKVMVRYPKNERRSIGHLERMHISTPDGSAVPLSQIATFDMNDSYASITRIDNMRAITISADADKTKVEPSKIAYEVFDEFTESLAKQYPNVKLALFGDSEEEGKTLIGLAQGAVMALFVIYALMAIPLRSYMQPLIIMSVIPFGLIGAIFGHLVQGLSLNVLSMMGIVALAGVVVNDSLILVNCVNEHQRDGESIEKAATEAGCDRFRAIVLTSMTTFFGLLPILFETSLQAQIVIPMATSLAFGIVFATCVTLILVPCLYLILNDGSLWFQKLFKNERLS